MTPEENIDEVRPAETAAPETAPETTAPAASEAPCCCEEEKACCCEEEKSCCCEEEKSCCCEEEKACCCEEEKSCCCECEEEKSCCCEEDSENQDKDEDEKPARANLPVIPVTDELVECAREKLAKMLELLEFKAEVRAEGGNNKINIIISSADAGRIIGRKGKNLENIQLLLNRMVQKEEAIYPRIYIDIDGYASGSRVVPEDGEEKPGKRFTRSERHDRHGGGRHEHGDRRGGRRFGGDEDGDRRGGRRERFDRGERRHGGGQEEENLRQLALDTAKEVKRWSDPKTLPPMNAHDRRIIHVTLENDADVKTYSVGEEPNKSVVVALKEEN